MIKILLLCFIGLGPAECHKNSYPTRVIFVEKRYDYANNRYIEKPFVGIGTFIRTSSHNTNYSDIKHDGIVFTIRKDRYIRIMKND